jgi:hypothetical protein
VGVAELLPCEAKLLFDINLDVPKSDYGTAFFRHSIN